MSWESDLADYQRTHPGATAADFAAAIQAQEAQNANNQGQAQFEANFELGQEGLALAREQFGYQKQKDIDRLANITDSMASIKNIFGGRQPTYDTLKGESFKLNNRRLNELQDNASRDLNFSLARSGNAGGSLEVDKNKELAEKMGLGVGQAEIFAQSQADQLKAQDDALKSSLQGLAASGAVGGASMAGTARSATQGRQGTAQYLGNIEGTFNNLSNRIGGANQRSPTRGGF